MLVTNIGSQCYPHSVQLSCKLGFYPSSSLIICSMINRAHEKSLLFLFYYKTYNSGRTVTNLALGFLPTAPPLPVFRKIAYVWGLLIYNLWLNGLEFEWTLGDSEGQGSLLCCSAWGGRVGHDSNWTATFSNNCRFTGSWKIIKTGPMCPALSSPQWQHLIRQ